MKVVEKFTSINGEGTRAGELAVFIRFKGCNLRCSYCDTMWANTSECPYKEETPEEILNYVLGTGIHNVTLTGGEPLLQKDIRDLIHLLLQAGLQVEIETNGAVDLAAFCEERPVFTMDYKLPSSGCEDHMITENMELLEKNDTVKFVSGSQEDLLKALELIRTYDLTNRCHVYLSPVFGSIEPVQIVEFMLKHRLNGVRLQIQMHKVIWDPDKRGSINSEVIEMKALVLFSGGIDSTTALGLAIQKYGKDQVIALSVSYGQKHDKEIKAAIAVAQYYGVEHLFLDLSKIFQYSNCSLLQQSTEAIPEESYAEQISKTNGDKPVSTYVPFRNGLFLSSAASIALSKDCEVIYYGAHADDSAGFAYPDCSPVFNQAMNEAIWEGSGHQLKIEAPFVNVSKAEVVRIGLELGVPYELTWSCYEGGEKPCGKCGTCIDRAAAFQANHMEDPALR